MLPEMEFHAAQETIAPGEALVVFTDGVTDARDANGTLFTAERLLTLLSHSAGSASETLQRIQSAVQAHAGDAAQFDDITLFAAHRQG